MRIDYVGLIVPFLLLSAGCGVVRSPRDGYGLVRKCDRSCLAKYTPDAPLYPANSKHHVLYEITGTAVRAFMGNASAQTCVVVWRPWEKGEGCKDMSYYKSLAQSLHERSVTFFLVSPYYDVPGARARSVSCNYEGRMFVIDHDAYGKRPRGRAQRLFVEDLLAGGIGNDSVAQADSYLFRGDSLVFAGGVDEMVTLVRR
jgi:hypothetical protein